MIWKLLFFHIHFLVLSPTSVGSYVLFAANIEDFRNIAKKIIPDHLADQLADMASKSSHNYQYKSNKYDNSIGNEANKKRYVIKNEQNIEDIDLDELVKRVKEKLVKEYQTNFKNDENVLKYIREKSLEEGELPSIDDYYYKDEAMNLSHLDYDGTNMTNVKTNRGSTLSPDYTAEITTESVQYDSQQKIDIYDSDIKYLTNEEDQKDGKSEAGSRENLKNHLYSKENLHHAGNANPDEYEYVDEHEDSQKHKDIKPEIGKNIDKKSEVGDYIYENEELEEYSGKKNNEQVDEKQEINENVIEKPAVENYDHDKLANMEYDNDKQTDLEHLYNTPGAAENYNEHPDSEKYDYVRPSGKYVNEKPEANDNDNVKPGASEYGDNNIEIVEYVVDGKPDEYNEENDEQHDTENAIIGHFDDKNENSKQVSKKINKKEEQNINEKDRPYNEENIKNNDHKEHNLETTHHDTGTTKYINTNITKEINSVDKVINNQVEKKISAEVKEVSVYYDEEKSAEKGDGLLKEVDLQNIKDSYEDYVTPKKDNIFESDEITTTTKLATVESKSVYHKAIIDSAANVTESTTQSIKHELEIKAKTESLWYDDSKVDEDVQINGTVIKATKKLKGTMIPKREFYKMSSPNYYAKIKATAEKYNFNEPLPEKDREREVFKDFGHAPASINKKVKLT